MNERQASINAEKLKIDLDDNLFYVLSRSGKTVAVNPKKFSWIAFFWSMIFYIFYRRWLGFALICLSAFVCDWLIKEGLKGAGDRGALWASIFFWSVTCGLAGYLGNKGKLKTLISSGWKILKKVEAKSSKEALALIDYPKSSSPRRHSDHYSNPISSVPKGKKRLEDLAEEINSNVPVPTQYKYKLSENDEKPEAMETTSDNLSGSEVTKQIGVAKEIEAFANLRDKGLITDEEFQAQKKKLLS